jgi:hypothetical protein
MPTDATIGGMKASRHGDWQCRCCRPQEPTHKWSFVGECGKSVPKLSFRPCDDCDRDDCGLQRPEYGPRFNTGMVSTRSGFPLLLTALVACGGGTTSSSGVSITVLAQPGEWLPLFAAASDDGTKIAFYGYDPTNKTRVGLVEGGRLVPVTPEGMNALDFAWMPDSRSLLVAYGPFRKPARFAILDLNGRLIRQVPFKGDFTVVERGMTVRNDGAVAVVSATRPGIREQSSDLLALDIRSGDYKNLTDTPNLSEASPSYIDPGHLVFVAGVPVFVAGEPNGWVGFLYLRDGSTHRLSASDQVVRSVTARWGADAAFFEAFQEGNRASQAIWTVGLSDGRTRRLISEQVTYPSVDGDDALVATSMVDGAILRLNLA